ETHDVLEQTRATEAEEIVAKFRILKVKLQQLGVGDGQHFSVLDAFDRLRAPVIGREKPKLADHASWCKLDVELLHQELAGDDQHHLVSASSLSMAVSSAKYLRRVINGFSQSIDSSPCAEMRAFFTRLSIWWRRTTLMGSNRL